MRTLLPIKLVKQAGKDRPACYEATEYTVSFNGICEECRPYCGSLCCTSFKFVALSDEEARSGFYRYKSEINGCECSSCQEMRQAGVKYSLLKNPDNTCINLNQEKKCLIYAFRPQTCQDYNCRGQVFPLQFDL